MDIQHTILIVDDTPENLRLLGSILEGQGYEILLAQSGAEALEIVATDPVPDLIFLDVMMPEMDGYEVCHRLKETPAAGKIPVIFISALDNTSQKVLAFQAGAVDYVTKPFQAEEVLARVHTQLQLKLHRDHMEDLVAQRTSDLLLSRGAIIASMALLAEFRDTDTGLHLQRTKMYLELVVGAYAKVKPDALRREQMDLIVQCGPLHDIGKIGVADSILHKSGPLTESECAEMMRHTTYGGQVIRKTQQTLGENSFLAVAEEIVEGHHEKWDGSGYPRGLKGEQIPFAARLMMLVDIYDALTSIRPYKKAFSHEDAFKIMTEGDLRTKPGHFDPELLEIFRSIHSEFARVAAEFSD